MRYFVITKRHILITFIAVIVVVLLIIVITNEKNEAVQVFGMKEIVSEVIPVKKEKSKINTEFEVDADDILNEFSPHFSKKTDSPAKPETPSPENKVTDIPKETEVAIEERKISGNVSEIKNETAYIVAAEEFRNTEYKFPKGGAVLIVHTHTTESYASEGFTSMSDNSRNVDEEKNVIAVGEVVASVLEENGISVIHDKTIHDYPSYQGAYNRSLNTIKKNLEDNPQIAAVLDIHRDAIIKSDGSRVKLAVDINSETGAQIMVVCGTNGSGLNHPDWKNNLHFGLLLTETAEKLTPGLMRPVNLREERFNQHLTSNSLIIEVGTHGNTLTEAKTGARCFAEAVADVIKKSQI